MKIFSKREGKQYDVLKLFKVVNRNSAKEFALKNCMQICVDFLIGSLNQTPDFFDLNYGSKIWRSLDSYESKIKKTENIDITTLTVMHTDSESMITISNDLSNTKDKELSSVEVLLASNVPFLENEKLAILVEKIYALLNFDYGYGLKLSDDYDFGTEKKIKKSLFGTSVSTSVTQDDIDWQKNIVKIVDGYYRKIYPINLLNDSQLESTEIQSLIGDNKVILTKMNNRIHFLDCQKLT